ncbi:hypothetical protein [uncultured Clostridium sp.]|uniref:hypothetical protein n=1 Tax=uncultured Clostridium sp. TaxID=59620 RepID=UPI00260EBD70|nr:hypothetical protein [uncultured Clostridium sp.]
MDKSLNFEIIKNTNLEKFYEYLKNDELVFNSDINKDMIFIDCRKLIEYGIKEMIFSKSGLGAYEESSMRSLKGNIIYIKEMIPKSIYAKLEYIRFAGNKYAHEIDKDFNHSTCLEYTYDFILWYLKNIEKKLPMDFNEKFKIPKDTPKEIASRESYSLNEEELLREVDELKETLSKTNRDREIRINNLNEELIKYKKEIRVLEEEGKKNKEALAVIKKRNAEPLLDVIQETINSNREIFKTEGSIIENIEAEEILEGVKESLKEVSKILKVINNEEELYKASNIEVIEDEYDYLNGALNSLNKDTLVLVYILLKDIKDENLLKKKGIMLNLYLNSKFKEIGKLSEGGILSEIKNEILKLTKSPKSKFKGIDEVLNNLHGELFKEENKGGIYLIDILDVYMQEMVKILNSKFKKSGSIKKVMLFSKVIGEVSSEDTVIILNLMRKYYAKDDINIEKLIQLDVESLNTLLKESKNLTEYITLSKFIIILLDGLKYKRDKVFKEILKKLKEKKIENKNINLILLVSAISLY